MTTVNLSPVINGTSVLGPTGLPLSGGLIYTFQAGSSTPLTTYTSNNGTIANTNPIVLHPDGRTPSEIWLQAGYSYKFQIENSLGVIVQTLDNIYGIPQSTNSGGSTSIPSGCIIIWSGAIGAVPSGYFLCDGTNGTPDLRSNFIVGAGSTYSVGQTGGSTDAILPSHTHTATSTVTDPGHQHTYAGNVSPTQQFLYAGGGGNAGIGTPFQASSTTNTATTSITVSTVNATVGISPTGGNLPPYYALAYIMKT
jgi:hypothetical protein